MNTYKWASLALMGMILLGIGIGQAHGKSSDTTLIFSGIAVMAAGVVQSLHGIQKQIDELKSPSEDSKLEIDDKPND